MKPRWTVVLRTAIQWAACLKWSCTVRRRGWARARTGIERLDGVLAQAVMSLQAVKRRWRLGAA